MDRQHRLDLYNRGWWITRDLEIIHVSNISDNHLLNILNLMVNRALEYENNRLSQFYSLPEPNGDMAQDLYWQGLNEVEDCDFSGQWLTNHPFTVHLLDELWHRNLQQ